MGAVGAGLTFGAEVQAAVRQESGSRSWGPGTCRGLVRRGLWGLRELAKGLRIHSMMGLHLGQLTAPCSPQALGLAGLVGEAEEPEEDEEQEGEGPLCPEKRFLRLSDGALLLRVLGIM